MLRVVNNDLIRCNTGVHEIRECRDTNRPRGQGKLQRISLCRHRRSFGMMYLIRRRLAQPMLCLLLRKSANCSRLLKVRDIYHTTPCCQLFPSPTSYAFGFLATIKYIGVNSFSLPPATKQSAAYPRLSAVLFVPFGAIPTLSSPPTAL